MKKIYDISWPITEDMTAYKDQSTVRLTARKNFTEHAVRETIFCCSSHTGTHVDAPSHFLGDGASVDAIPLEGLIGRAIVLDFTHIETAIMADDVRDCSFEPGTIVLCKTRNSRRSVTEAFDYDFVYLAADAAALLVEYGAKAVGIDYLGIERRQADHATHTQLLSRGIAIIEGLRLGAIAAGMYDFICLPLLLVGIDGAPARAILMA